MRIASTELYKTFVAHKNSQFLFVEQLGNFGDDLLILGAEKLARSAGCSFAKIKYSSFRSVKSVDQSIVYIHGGGNFNDIWAGASVSALKKAVSLDVSAVILGPQTFLIEERFLKDNLIDVIKARRCSELYLFTREKVSFEALVPLVSEGVKVILDHDTALNLDKSDVFSSREVQKYVLYAIRQDKEAGSTRVLNPLSFVIDPVSFARDFEEWVCLHARAKKVITNRLHSAILSSILGKEVVLLPNSYYKNRAVWEHSLNELGVQWEEDVKSGVLSQLLEKIPMIRMLSDSWKWRQVVSRFYTTY